MRAHKARKHAKTQSTRECKHIKCVINASIEYFLSAKRFDEPLLRNCIYVPAGFNQASFDFGNEVFFFWLF